MLSDVQVNSVYPVTRTRDYTDGFTCRLSPGDKKSADPVKVGYDAHYAVVQLRPDATREQQDEKKEKSTSSKLSVRDEAENSTYHAREDAWCADAIEEGDADVLVI